MTANIFDANLNQRLNFPHSISWYNLHFLGGFKLELLGADESVIATLTPGDQFVDDDPTQQSTELKLPEDECVGCAVGDHSGQTLSLFWYSQATGHVITLSLILLLILLFQIRLIREAAEWGPRYKFWSCADVDIVKVWIQRIEFVN